MGKYEPYKPGTIFMIAMATNILGKIIFITLKVMGYVK